MTKKQWYLLGGVAILGYLLYRQGKLRIGGTTTTAQILNPDGTIAQQATIPVHHEGVIDVPVSAVSEVITSALRSLSL